MRFIITGASGVLGFALIKKLIEDGNEVSILARSEGSLSHIFDEFGRDAFTSVHFIDLKDYVNAQLEIPGDVFIHLAWEGVEKEARDNIELQMKNVGYTLDAIKLSKRLGCKVFVGAGSQAEFADSNTPMGNHTPTIPNTAYGAAKLAAGQMGRLLAESLGLRFYWFRIFSLFGPYDRRYSFMSIMLEKFLKDEPLDMTSGDQIWDYFFSYDAARTLLEVIKSNNSSIYISLGSGKGFSLIDYVLRIKNILKSNSIINNSIKLHSNARRYLVADRSVISNILTEMELTSLEIAIKTTIKEDRRMNK
jgi:UDP-glucose 4-epimerase